MAVFEIIWIIAASRVRGRAGVFLNAGFYTEEGLQVVLRLFMLHE